MIKSKIKNKIKKKDGGQLDSELLPGLGFAHCSFAHFTQIK